MTLIASISGIRGTIGGKVGEGLSPIDAQRYSLAYGMMVLSKHTNPTVVIGRDARISGQMIANIVSSSLVGLGINVVDLGLSTTPTVEKAVKALSAQGGIIITASHNPKEWNALKLLNEVGEFINDDEGKKIIEFSKQVETIQFPDIDNIGKITSNDEMITWHIKEICQSAWVNTTAIKDRNPKIVVDGINSTGGLAVPELLKALGIDNVIVVNGEPTGNFAHNPEPLAAHLVETCQIVVKQKADLGIVVDPDVDRLCFINEDGSLFGEEYTLVAVADYILSKKPGNTVSNLSSTRALRDITEKHGGKYFASAVGEVNVTAKMKESNAIIGGEGNGGVIFPESHYGRDALMGIGLFLSYYAERNQSMTNIKTSLPSYFMSKNKIELTPAISVDNILNTLHQKYSSKESCNIIDGLKIDFSNEWVHLRKSNTEPIIRIYSEAMSQEAADLLAHKFVEEIREMI
jgi:phosphomannomutase